MGVHVRLCTPLSWALPNRSTDCNVPRTVRARVERWVWVVGVVAAAVPLWVSADLPMVDLPQHLHLISALHRVDDATTLYPQFFERRAAFTPYLGYYYSVHLLNWLLPLQWANRAFLSLYAVGVPLSLALLLWALRRPTWPALLSVPLVYGENFAWGFVNYQAALPVSFVACAAFIKSLEEGERQRAWAAASALAVAGVLAFHVQVFAFLAFALPLLLLTSIPLRPFWRPRRWALASVAPAVALFFVWVAIRAQAPADIAPGQPWKAWGPMFSPENLSVMTFAQCKEALLPQLSGVLADGRDGTWVKAALMLALVAFIVGLISATMARPAQGLLRQVLLASRPLLLCAIALTLYFTVPFDIRGYMYTINVRFAQLAALLAVVSIPVLSTGLRRVGIALGATLAVTCAVSLGSAFRSFSAEMAELNALVDAAPRGPRVMGLIYNPASQVAAKPVFLHASAVVARERGGITNFSFASTPHSPMKYKGALPPTFPSEWRPDTMDWDSQGSWYDTFVVRGVHPAQVFGGRLGKELEVTAQSGSFWLVRRKSEP